MDALILAAGFGTRLYPLTEDMPKALIKINGKPILDNTLEKLDKVNELERIYIVTNNKFCKLFQEWIKQAKTDKKIILINNRVNSENEKKGAIGDFKFALDKINYNDLFVLASDHLFNFDLNELISESNKKGTSILAARKMEKEKIMGKYGCVDIDSENKIVYFEEKPQNPRTEFCAIACYFMIKEDLDKIKNHKFQNNENMGYLIDFLQKNSRIYAKILKEKWIDIGSKTELEKAEKEFENG